MKNAFVIFLSIIMLSTFLYSMDSDPNSPKNGGERLSYFIALKLPKKETLTDNVEKSLLYDIQTKAIEKIRKQIQEQQSELQEQLRQAEYKRNIKRLEEEKDDFKALINRGNFVWACMKSRADYLDNRIKIENARISAQTDITAEEIQQSQKLCSQWDLRLKRVVEGMDTLDMSIARIEADLNRLEARLAIYKAL